MSNKVFSTEFKLDSKMLAIIYICYEYKFPLSFMLSFYELYGDVSLFALKALTCTRKIKITDSTLIKIIEESRSLYKQIVRGIDILTNKARLTDDKDEKPILNLDEFSDEYKDFVNTYLLNNIENIFSPVVKLRFGTEDLYEELKP